MRVLRLLCLCLFGMILPALAGAQDAAQQERDRGFLVGLIEDNLSNVSRTVVIDGFAGALSSRATVEVLSIADAEGIWLEARGLAFEWNRGALLRGRIDVVEMSADTITFFRQPLAEPSPPNPEASPFSLPELPVAIKIDRLRADEIILGAPLLGEETSLSLDGSVSLDGGTGTANIVAERLDGQGRFDIAGSYDNASRQLALAVSLQEEPGGLVVRALDLSGQPSVDLTLQGDGALEDFSADLTLATNGIERITGQFGFVQVTDDAAGNRLDIRLGVEGDVGALLPPDYAAFFGNNARLGVQIERPDDGSTNLRELQVATQSLSLSGTAELTADGWPRRVALTGRVAADDGSPVLLPLSGPRTFVNSADLVVGFDAAAGDRWTAQFGIDGFARPGVTIPQLTLDGGGVIMPRVGDNPGRFDAALTYAARDLSLTNPDLATALGANITGDLALARDGDGPFRITTLTVEGPGLGVVAEGTISGPGEGLVIASTIALDATDLGRFGGLSGLEGLGGAASLQIVSSVAPLDGSFEIDLTGGTTDLALGLAQLDPLLIGTGEIAVTADRDTTGTRLSQLNITTPGIAITGEAEITSTASDALFDLTVRELSLALPGLDGPGRVQGIARRDAVGQTVITASASLPQTSVQIDAILAPEDAGGVATADVRADIGDLGPFSALAGRDLAGSLTARIAGTVQPDLSQFDLTVTGESNDLAIGVAQLDPVLAGAGTLSGQFQRTTPGSLKIEGFRLATPALGLSATADITDGTGVADFALALTDAGLVEPRLSGPVQISGNAALDAEAMTTLSVNGIGPGATQLGIDATLTSPEDGSVIAGTVEANIGTLSAFSGLAGRDLAGRISARLGGAGRMDLSGFDMTYDIAGTGIVAEGIPLNGALTVRGDAQRDAAGVALSLAATGPGGAAIDLLTTLSDLTPDADLLGRLSARVASLAPYSGLAGRDLSGTLSAELEGDGRLDLSALDLSFDLSGRDLGAGDLSLPGTIAAQGQVNRQDNGAQRLELTANGPGGAVVDIALLAGSEADGGLVATDLSVEIADLAAYSGVGGVELGGGVSLDIEGTTLPNAARFDLSIEAETRNIDVGSAPVADLLRGTGRITADVTRGDEGGVTLTGASISYPNLVIAGSLDGRGGAGSGRFNASLTDIGIFAPDFRGPVNVEGTATRKTGGFWLVRTNATGPGGIASRVTGSVIEDGTLDLRATGVAPLGLANAVLDPRRIRGTANFDLTAQGRPGLAALAGTITTNDGQLADPSLGRALENIEATIRLAGARLDLQLGADASGGGRLDVSGPIALSGGFNSDLAITLRNLVQRDPNLYETTADADLRVNGPLTGGAVISGTVSLGTTEVQVPSSDIGTLGDLPSVRHITPSAGVRQTLSNAGLSLSGGDAAQGDGDGGARAYPLDITINAPTRIFIRGRGLDAELGGSLRIGGTTGQVIPAGQFNLIRGRLDILQQRFALDEGSVTLQGDFVPFLRLVATTNISDGTVVKIIIEGPASEPVVRFESEPSYPQDEVLARLIFGRDLSQISPLQAVQLAAAVSTLAGRGGGGLINSFRQDLGLDNLDLTTDTEGNAAVQAGKYLTDQIYSEVTVGTNQTTIDLNLDLTEDVTVTGSANSDGSTSLGVFLERDY